ncbi:transposase, partial [Streptomyces sp. AK02-04a]|uniref:transposase n=1 Tax=Streptomyces sp. AK02-04a TaxID=3028649 RepID=UPI0029BF2FFD
KSLAAQLVDQQAYVKLAENLEGFLDRLRESARSLTLLPQDQQAALEERRREQLTDQWQQRYNIRAGVEGTISQAIRRTGIRRTRYTSLPKTRLGHIFAATATATAINIIRLDAWLSETPLGGTRTSHLARLQLAA